ncbi:MAG: heavy-metal-associated domain-containing protein [Lautropia sp.]|nr:heavy-metal-associated domain-containing protein [Lautropia sp.]
MIQFQIPDMSCKHCERAVTEAVKQVDPNASLTVDLDNRQVTIGSSTEAAAFAKALSEAGYETAPVAAA